MYVCIQTCTILRKEWYLYILLLYTTVTEMNIFIFFMGTFIVFFLITTSTSRINRGISRGSSGISSSGIDTTDINITEIIIRANIFACIYCIDI